jgi:hypothetical protein
MRIYGEIRSDVPDAKPAGSSHSCRLQPRVQASATCACRCARKESTRVFLSTPISIGAVRKVTHRGAIQRRKVMRAAIIHAPCHAI